MNQLTALDLVHIALAVELPALLNWPNVYTLVDIIQKQYPNFSKSHIKRLIQQGAVKLDNVKVDEESLVLIGKETIVQVGKRNYFKINRND